MSTRATVHFQSQGKDLAIIYRHSDGYPDGIGRDLETFFKDVEAQCPDDTRFGDPTYLAAKFVVWQAAQYTHKGNPPLSFLSVGVYLSDPCDIQYRYLVDCDSGDRPKVLTEKV